MKKILVTGGVGFIGSNFIRLLLDERKDYKVICVDSLTYAANPHTLDDLFSNSNFFFYKENICNIDGIKRIFETEHPDIVVNFAAETHVDRSIENPKVFLETNILGTQVLLDACRMYGIQRFHQVSTDEVYGDLPLDQPNLFFREETPINPKSPYAVSKASADLLVLSYYRTYGLPITISRCSNNYGPYQFPEKLIPLMINNSLKNEKLPVYGKGLNIRDWIYVKDHCYGILAIVERGNNGEIYNIGSHNEKTNIDVIRTILKKLDKPFSLINYVEDRKGHDLRYAIDSSKLMNKLGWKPMVRFTDGMDYTIQWYKENKKWMDECTSGEYLEYYKRMYEKEK